MTELFALVGDGFAGATDALLSGDKAAAKTLIERDRLIDTLYRQLLSTAQTMLKEHRLSSYDINYLITVLRLIPELERSGDLAEHIAQRALIEIGQEMTPRSRGIVQQMGDIGTQMWRMATDAFCDKDLEAATTLDNLDDDLDELHLSLITEIVAGTMPISVIIETAMVARFYERFGDHAVNIARACGQFSQR
ncbi:MAG: hypothetical protein M1288_04830 [Actinobacteria bacterium]|jgi:phosphate transport system protein|nr:hypothetical protein [Actinomycetota bacterium]